MLNLELSHDWLAVLLGVVQGVTEFLPISSSAHLVLLPALGHQDYLGKTFDVALHLGTLLAILIYFREDVKTLILAALNLVKERRFSEEEPARKMVVMLILGTIPAAFAGALFDDFIEERLNLVPLIAANLILFGVVLEASDRVGSKKRSLNSLSIPEAILVGLAQMCALVPGVSRSGSTMTTSLFLGLTREAAARFSFLLSLPITAGAVAFKGLHVLKHPDEGTGLFEPMLVGTVVSAVSGFLCIHYLLKYLRTRSFLPFTVYRLLLGALVLGLWAAGLLGK